MFAEAMKEYGASRAPSIFSSPGKERQIVVEPEELYEEEVYEEEPEKVPTSSITEFVGQRMNIVAKLLGCSDKTGMKYYRELQYFFPPNYLATGSRHSPIFTQDGIEVLKKYANLSLGEKYQYKQKLKADYEDWCNSNGIPTNQEIDAIAFQVSQLICDRAKLKAIDILKEEAARFIEEIGVKAKARECVIKFRTEFYQEINEEIGEG